MRVRAIFDVGPFDLQSRHEAFELWYLPRRLKNFISGITVLSFTSHELVHEQEQGKSLN